MNPVLKKYGFEVGKIYQSKMQIMDETGRVLPTGTLVRIIAITPKVRVVTGFRNTDSKEYFYNAVLHNQVENYPRIRENFCTLYKKEIK